MLVSSHLCKPNKILIFVSLFPHHSFSKFVPKSSETSWKIYIFNDTLAIHWTLNISACCLCSLIIILDFPYFNFWRLFLLFVCILAWLRWVVCINMFSVHSDSIPFQSLSFQIRSREFSYFVPIAYIMESNASKLRCGILSFLSSTVFLDFSSNSNDIFVATYFTYYCVYVWDYCDWMFIVHSIFGIRYSASPPFQYPILWALYSTVISVSK